MVNGRDFERFGLLLERVYRGIRGRERWEHCTNRYIEPTVVPLHSWEPSGGPSWEWRWGRAHLWERHRHRQSWGFRESGIGRLDMLGWLGWLRTKDMAEQRVCDGAKTRIWSGWTDLLLESVSLQGHRRLKTQSMCSLEIRDRSKSWENTPVSCVDWAVADVERFLEESCRSPSFVSCAIDDVLNLIARSSSQSHPSTTVCLRKGVEQSWNWSASSSLRDEIR